LKLLNVTGLPDFSKKFGFADFKTRVQVVENSSKTGLGKTRVRNNDSLHSTAVFLRKMLGTRQGPVRTRFFWF